MADMKINVTTDTTRQLIRSARIIAKHLTALADELEVPDGIIGSGDRILTEEEAEKVKADFAEKLHTGKMTGGEPA